MANPNKTAWHARNMTLVLKHQEYKGSYADAQVRRGELALLWSGPYQVRVRETTMSHHRYAIRVYHDTRKGPDTSVWDGGKFVPGPEGKAR